MRGFAATPMIIVVITMIVGFLVIHFLSIDSWIANVITQTSEVHKLQANALKNLAKDRQTIYMYAISEAAGAQNENELESALLQVHTDNFRVEDVVISNDSIMLRVRSSYKENLMSSGIDTCVTSTFYVDYPFGRLIEAAEYVKGYHIGSSTCGGVESEMASLSNSRSQYNIFWDYYGNVEDYEKCDLICTNCCDNCTRYVEERSCDYSYEFQYNYISNTVSESYRHYVGATFKGTCTKGSCSC